jgi:hypothetical protein
VAVVVAEAGCDWPLHSLTIQLRDAKGCYASHHGIA